MTQVSWMDNIDKALTFCKGFVFYFTQYVTRHRRALAGDLTKQGYDVRNLEIC